MLSAFVVPGTVTVSDIIVQNQPVCKPADFFFYSETFFNLRRFILVSLPELVLNQPAPE
ncbi:hypothetical protein BACCAP_02075 [Pseudoflavonifractor capillosus ATCC 29799]|uniref:Uncharacterized protein n=1 Tax=Pseudoflavonifractor capillosus ATCC 29799 TaxID=411467 RepID=A6NV40_9FIRM|nr:hypothetical protein BACCAP_02075 [Pseudoflavonifractor capillosus ATCC 29799]